MAPAPFSAFTLPRPTIRITQKRKKTLPAHLIVSFLTGSTFCFLFILTYLIIGVPFPAIQDKEQRQMKNGKCPRCGGTEIHSGVNVPLKSGPFASNAIPISLTSMAALDNYVCTACGLVESYIAEPTKLEEVVKTWARVLPGSAGKQ
jgi:hypothetical protein